MNISNGWETVLSIDMRAFLLDLDVALNSYSKWMEGRRRSWKEGIIKSHKILLSMTYS